MKRLIPRRAELAVFAVLAFGCALVASLTLRADVALVVMGFPLFLVAAWMGMRRSGQWAQLGRQLARVEQAGEGHGVAAGTNSAATSADDEAAA